MSTASVTSCPIRMSASFATKCCLASRLSRCTTARTLGKGPTDVKSASEVFGFFFCFFLLFGWLLVFLFVVVVFFMTVIIFIHIICKQGTSNFFIIFLFYHI